MYYALFLILNDVKHLENIHQIFFDHSCGATTLDSVGMGKVLLENHVDTPIFAGIRKLVEGNMPYNKTIISVMKGEEKMQDIVTCIKRELGAEEMKQGGIGFMFVLPVLECHGFIIDDEVGSLNIG